MKVYIRDHLLRLSIFLAGFLVYYGYVSFYEIKNTHISGLLPYGLNDTFLGYSIAYIIVLLSCRWWRAVQSPDQGVEWRFFPLWAILILNTASSGCFIYITIPETSLEMMAEMEGELLIFSKLKNGLQLTKKEEQVVLKIFTENYPKNDDSFQKYVEAFKVYPNRDQFIREYRNIQSIGTHFETLSRNYIIENEQKYSSDEKNELALKIENRFNSLTKLHSDDVKREFNAEIKVGHFYYPGQLDWGPHKVLMDRVSDDSSLLAALNKTKADEVINQISENFYKSVKKFDNEVRNNYSEWLDKATKNGQIKRMSPLEKLGYVTGTVSKTLSDTKDELIDEPVKGFWDGFEKARDQK